MHKERVPSTGLTIILGIVTVMLWAMFLWQVATGFLGPDPVGTWFLFFMAVFFVLVTWNFRHIDLLIDDDGVLVKYGFWRRREPWQNITGAEIDSKHWFYGYGIRLGRYKGRWVWVYNVMGGPRIAFLMEKGGFLVSTRQPEEAMEEAKKHLGSGHDA